MSRQPSIAAFKKQSEIGKKLPRENTKLRNLYDTFLVHAGKAIDLDLDNHGEGRRVQDLIDYYGCDIRWCGRRKYLLAGEIQADGKYLDYVALNLKSQE